MKNISRVKRKTLSIELVDHLEIMSVSDLIVYNTMLFIHKIVLGKAPQYLTNKIKFYKGIKKYNSLQTKNR